MDGRASGFDAIRTDSSGLLEELINSTFFLKAGVMVATLRIINDNGKVIIQSKQNKQG